jgi:hypothetical protein
MFSLAVVTWIGNAAAVLSGQWGTVSQRAREVGCSREAMYQQARRVEQAVVREQAGGPSREALLAENQRLRDENRTLWALLEEAESVSKALQQKFAATASAMGLSLTQIIKLLAMMLPSGGVPSRATVGRWVEQSSCRAGGILKVLDRACQAWVLTLCLDEIFFHREPVLVAVEADSLAWVAGQRGPDRTGESWCRLLQQWPGLERVVSDAGTGLARGVKLLNEARAVAAAAEPEQPAVAPVQVGLDVFHTEREMQRIVGRRWAQVEKLVDAAAQAEQQVEEAKRRGIDARGAAARARAAWSKAERAFDAAVQVEAAVERIKAALALLRPDGRLNDRAWAQQQITEALGELVGEAWSKVRRLLGDVRTLNHLDWMHEQLAQAVPDARLREAVVRLWYWRGQVGRGHGTQQTHAVQMVLMAQLLCRQLCSDWPQAYARVGHILSHTVRASSAVECMNSVLRMHQARHRQVSQGMLDLKRLYWNCRTFTHGKRRGAYPYQLLGLRLPTDDWWELLQMDPEKLEQKLSIQEVMV